MGVYPFLKWNGGKTRSLGYFCDTFRAQKGKRLVEPFVGGGSVFMAFADSFPTFRLNDLNPDLINCYLVLRDKLDEFLPVYMRLVNVYLTARDKADLYYSVLDIFNSGDVDGVERAACMVVLNKTCYNGLYRVNRSGKLNASWGKRDKPRFPFVSELKEISTLLHRADISSHDFAQVEIRSGDFVYLDPPYYTSNGKFTAYTKEGFGCEDQVRVRDFVYALDKAGIPFALSNSWFDELNMWFPPEWIRKLSISRCLAQLGEDRGMADEVLVSNVHCKRGE